MYGLPGVARSNGAAECISCQGRDCLQPVCAICRNCCSQPHWWPLQQGKDYRREPQNEQCDHVVGPTLTPLGCLVVWLAVFACGTCSLVSYAWARSFSPLFRWNLTGTYAIRRSRFDVIFILLDKPDEDRDHMLSEHIMAIHRNTKDGSKCTSASFLFLPCSSMV